MSAKIVELPVPKKIVPEKPKKKRVITQQEKWKFSQNEILDTNQIEYMAPFFDPALESTDKTNLIFKQIRDKISGYRAQDIEKKKFDEERFVNKDDVFSLFETSGLLCYYCKGPTRIIYEFVRDPKQWTLERLDNSMGHNRDNVVLSCLQCNLKRRCMKSEKYVETKAMSVIIKMERVSP